MLSDLKITRVFSKMSALMVCLITLWTVPIAAQGDETNLLPKFGPSPPTAAAKAANDVFVSGVASDYHDNRAKAASDMAIRGWQYLQAGDFQTAMRRFNQAWLLNPHDGIALWGMAAIESSSAKYREAIALFAEAQGFVGNNLNFSIDYAKAVGAAGVELKDASLLNDALVRYQKLYDEAPQNGRNLKNWAKTLFDAGKYADAWKKVKLAEALPGEGNFDPKFLAALQERMPRPLN